MGKEKGGDVTNDKAVRFDITMCLKMYFNLQYHKYQRHYSCSLFT